MDGPVTDLSPCNTGTPKRRNVRRRMVQSTLFPKKPQEPDDKADANDDKDCREDEPGEEEEEDCCASGSQKKRKSRGKVTPRTKGSKRDKQQQNSTPKKNVSANGIKGASSRQLLADLAQSDAPIPDLRLEAKLSAEENSRMFAGRQMHPFFSSWKVGKKFQESAESAHNFCTLESNVGRNTCGPIHVFENTQDVVSLLDWSNWTFLGEATNENDGLESLTSSVLECSFESLKFDKIPSTLNPSNASICHNGLSCSDQLAMQTQNLQEMLPASSNTLASGQTILQTPEDATRDLEVDEVGIFSGQAGIFRQLDTEPQNRFLQESMRPYYHSYEDKAQGSLWTYKYKPTKAFEVCGNDESVNFLCDWLRLWHERRYQSRKGSSNRDKSEIQDDDEDCNCSHSDYESEDMNNEDCLQNVLLITGPIGSGKSAAVYACAQEQGFEVLELNTSDCRNGTAVKQYFGDALGSLGFKRVEHTVRSRKKKNMELPPAPSLHSSEPNEKLNDGVTELIPISDDEAHSPDGTSQRSLGKKDIFTYDKVQTLILVEDVDVLYPEDRGCIAAIQQIAETGKGPIILTSNSNNPGLPDNLKRLHVSFLLPSPMDLLGHLYMVCVAEGVNIHPFLLEKFIQSCDGDIRKTIMHLQFWFQIERFGKDRKVQTAYGSIPFDLEVGHQILPKILPWDFPSQLSELVEKEIDKSITIMEENFNGQWFVEEEFDISERQNDIGVQHKGADCIEAKKVEMLKRNGSVMECTEIDTRCNPPSEFSNSSGLLVASSQRKVRRRLVVMSSDSEDEDLNNEYAPGTCNDTDKGQPMEDNIKSLSEFPLNQSPSFHRFVCSGLEDLEAEHCKSTETADNMCLNETCKSSDISCVPESTFVPETLIENGIETMSGAVSSGHLADSVEVSVNNELIPFSFSVCKRLTKLRKDSDLLLNTKIPDSSQIQKEAVQDSLDETMETATVFNVMDECSRVDFKVKSNFIEPSQSVETDMVQNVWRNLRDCETDLRQFATEQPGASEVIKLACGMSNLISEADLLVHNNRQKQSDILEPSVFLSDEPTFSCYDEQMMMSTVAAHGFCFYAKHIADVGSKYGFENRLDLTSEMLASTTDVMALGKLSRQDLTKSIIAHVVKGLEGNEPRIHLLKSEMKTSLFNVIQSLVPARLSLAMKGVAFYEYVSSLRQISSAEAFRISQGVEMRRRRRVAGAGHYLSSGRMILSSEDISLLCEGDLYRKISSQYTGANVERNFT